MLIIVMSLYFRASELAFALDPLPKDELPPTPSVTEVSKVSCLLLITVFFISFKYFCNDLHVTQPVPGLH